MSNKFEQLLDLIVNEENEKAEQLFHEIVVERSRSIYENLLQDAEQEVQEKIGGNAVDAMIDDIETEEENVTVEAEDDEEEMPGEEPAADMPAQPEMGAEDGEEGDVEERLDDIEAMLQQFQDELDTALAKIDGEEAGEDGEEMGMPADEEGEEKMAGEAALGLVREYKEKVGEPFKGGKVAASGTGDGEKSPIATKGGTMPTAKGVDFAGGDEKGRSAPTAKSMNATTEPNMKKVSGGAEKGSGDGEKSPVKGA
jgi:hypothetical protein